MGNSPCLVLMIWLKIGILLFKINPSMALGFGSCLSPLRIKCLIGFCFTKVFKLNVCCMVEELVWILIVFCVPTIMRLNSIFLEIAAASNSSGLNFRFPPVLVALLLFTLLTGWLLIVSPMLFIINSLFLGRLFFALLYGVFGSTKIKPHMIRQNQITPMSCYILFLKGY